MSDNHSTELIRTQSQRGLAVPTAEYDGIRFMMSPAEAAQRLVELRAFIKTVMKPGINGDYAVIPGTEKATLLQPGAQKLCEIYGFAVSYVDVETVKDWQNNFFYFEKKCVLTSRRDGRFICDGIGSCNSKEDRYAGRWVNEEEVPKALDKSTLKRKEQQTKRGLWVRYRCPNDDICSIVNTLQKMACKRALIHAVLTATRSADIFTQDLEHVDVTEAVGEVEDTRSWEKPDEDQRSVEEKVKAFEEQIRAARTVQEFNAVATALSQSDLPMSAGNPLRKLWTDCKAEHLGKAGEKPKAESPPPSEPEKPGAAPAAAPASTQPKGSKQRKADAPKPDAPAGCDRQHGDPPCGDHNCWLLGDAEPPRER